MRRINGASQRWESAGLEEPWKNSGLRGGFGSSRAPTATRAGASSARFPPRAIVTCSSARDTSTWWHVARLAELEPAELAEMAETIDRSERVLRRELGTDLIQVGFNLGRAAGAGIEGHLHAHLVPRGAGDPDAEGPDLDRLHARLAPAFEQSERRPGA